MADILLFTPKRQLDAKANLNDFISMCRDRLTVFGADLDWGSFTWAGVGNFTVNGAPAKGFTQDQLLILILFLSLRPMFVISRGTSQLS